MREKNRLPITTQSLCKELCNWIARNTTNSGTVIWREPRFGEENWKVSPVSRRKSIGCLPTFRVTQGSCDKDRSHYGNIPSVLILGSRVHPRDLHFWGQSLFQWSPQHMGQGLSTVVWALRHSHLKCPSFPQRKHVLGICLCPSPLSLETPRLTPSASAYSLSFLLFSFHSSWSHT